MAALVEIQTLIWRQSPFGFQPTMLEESEEILPVVDENDVVVGAQRRGVVHERGLRHRSAHVLVFNGKGELLIQLRGPSKREYPLHWDVSVGGHVGPGETYEQAARRELREEVGLDGEIQFFRRIAATERNGGEFTALYTLTSDRPIVVNRREIERCEFVSPRKLLEEIRSGQRRATPALLQGLSLCLDEERAEGETTATRQ